MKEECSLSLHRGITHLEQLQDSFYDHLENFEKHYDRLRSLVYEQLCDTLLIEHYTDKKSIVGSGSYWNIHSEFDILAVSKDKKIVDS